MRRFILIALIAFCFYGCSLAENEPESTVVIERDQYTRLAQARAEYAALLSNIENMDELYLPEYNARLFDHQAVIIHSPNNIYGSAVVVSSVYQRDGIDFLWVSEIAPVGMFNWSVLEREFDELADSKEHNWGYYYLTVKPDFYQNKVTAVEITADEYYRIIAAYSDQ